MLQNRKVHTNCFCYDDTTKPLVELREYTKHENFRVKVFDQQIVIVLKGRIVIEVRHSDRKGILNGGQFAFVPSSSELDCEVSGGTSMMICRIPAEVPECHIYRVNKMMGMSDYDKMYVARIKPRLATFVKSLYETMTDGLLCRIYLEMEMSRLLFLIHAYYPLEECLKLFAPVASPDVEFSEFVRLNHVRCRTVEAMAIEVNLSVQQFSKRFRKVMGSSPREWLQAQKARNIYRDLCRSDIPIKEIADKHDFMQPNFIRYCRTKFGMTPGMIRKKLECVGGGRRSDSE